MTLLLLQANAGSMEYTIIRPGGLKSEPATRQWRADREHGGVWGHSQGRCGGPRDVGSVPRLDGQQSAVRCGRKSAHGRAEVRGLCTGKVVEIS